MTAAGIPDLQRRYRMEDRLSGLLDDKIRSREAGHSGDSPSLAARTAALTGFLRAELGGDVAVHDMARMSGGGANETYGFVLDHAGQSGRFALRIKTPGAICATDATREFQMLGVVSRVLPAPKPLAVTEDPAWFGAPAFVAEFVSGTSVPTFDVPKATGLGVTYGARLRKSLAAPFIEHCAALHSYDGWDAADLGAFDIPRAGTTDAIDWRLAFWERSWEQDKVEEHPAMLLTRQWLEENKPAADRISLLHGDYRNGNFLFEEETGEFVSVIDWELCYLGDRHSDLAYTMLPGWGSLDENGVFLVAGLVDTETFIAEYERRSGLSIDIDTLNYYYVYNYYWAIESLLGTGPGHAHRRLTQLDVMYNFISGLGGRFVGDVNALILEDLNAAHNS